MLNVVARPCDSEEPCRLIDVLWWPKQEKVHKSKYGCVRADAQSERHAYGKAQDRFAPEHPKGSTDRVAHMAQFTMRTTRENPIDLSILPAARQATIESS